MNKVRRRYWLGLGLCFVLIGAGCDSSWTLDLSNAGHTTSPLITPAKLYADWTKVSTGVDFKQVLLKQGTSEELLDIVRVDPTQAKVTLHVDEMNPATVSSWQEKLGATVVLNASYFDEQYQLVTRTVTETEEVGPLLSGQTGFFYEQDGDWKISNQMPASSVTQLLQSYPLLVVGGDAAVSDSANDTAQRTLVATNAAGMLYFIVAEYGVLTLAELSTGLTQLDQPAVEFALNFDGGSSTGLMIASPNLQYQDDSFLVPAVVAIE